VLFVRSNQEKRVAQHLTDRAVEHCRKLAGSWVVIKTGAMAGMEGILTRMQNDTRVLIGLNSISRAFTVEADSRWAELGTHLR
jgi:hypothetical protein